jgi:hypothetical protein
VKRKFKDLEFDIDFIKSHVRVDSLVKLCGSTLGLASTGPIPLRRSEYEFLWPLATSPVCIFLPDNHAVDLCARLRACGCMVYAAEYTQREAFCIGGTSRVSTETLACVLRDAGVDTVIYIAAGQKMLMSHFVANVREHLIEDDELVLDIGATIPTPGEIVLVDVVGNAQRKNQKVGFRTLYPMLSGLQGLEKNMGYLNFSFDESYAPCGGTGGAVATELTVYSTLKHHLISLSGKFYGSKPTGVRKLRNDINALKLLWLRLSSKLFDVGSTLGLRTEVRVTGRLPEDDTWDILDPTNVQRYTGFPELKFIRVPFEVYMIHVSKVGTYMNGLRLAGEDIAEQQERAPLERVSLAWVNILNAFGFSLPCEYLSIRQVFFLLFVCVF